MRKRKMRKMNKRKMMRNWMRKSSNCKFTEQHCHKNIWKKHPTLQESYFTRGINALPWCTQTASNCLHALPHSITRAISQKIFHILLPPPGTHAHQVHMEPRSELLYTSCWAETPGTSTSKVHKTHPIWTNTIPHSQARPNKPSSPLYHTGSHPL